MEYVLKGGTRADDAYFERLSAAAAEGDYPGVPGEWVVRPQGRPRIAEEELVSVAFKMPRSQREALDKAAQSCGETRSQFMRRALAAALA